jgi:hypothetical protein
VPHLQLVLTVVPETLAICHLSAADPVPDWTSSPVFSSVTRTAEELSVVCPQSQIPAGIECDRDWKCLKVRGPLDFSLTGILSSLAAPLAASVIPLFAISTYNTDYILVKAGDLERAIRALAQAGHVVENA